MSDPMHVPVVFEGPLGFGTVQNRIPTFQEEGDNIFEVPSMDTSVIRNELQQYTLSLQIHIGH